MPQWSVVLWCSTFDKWLVNGDLSMKKKILIKKQSQFELQSIIESFAHLIGGYKCFRNKIQQVFKTKNIFLCFRGRDEIFREGLVSEWGGKAPLPTVGLKHSFQSCTIENKIKVYLAMSHVSLKNQFLQIDVEDHIFSEI